MGFVCCYACLSHVCNAHTIQEHFNRNHHHHHRIVIYRQKPCREKYYKCWNVRMVFRMENVYFCCCCYNICYCEAKSEWMNDSANDALARWWYFSLFFYSFLVVICTAFFACMSASASSLSRTLYVCVCVCILVIILFLCSLCSLFICFVSLMHFSASGCLL